MTDHRADDPPVDVEDDDAVVEAEAEDSDYADFTDFTDNGEDESVWAITPRRWQVDPFDVTLIAVAPSGTTVSIPVTDDLLDTMVGIAAAQNQMEPGHWPELEPEPAPRGILAALSDKTGWTASNRVWDGLPPRVQFGLIGSAVIILLALLIYTTLFN